MCPLNCMSMWTIIGMEAENLKLDSYNLCFALPRKCNYLLILRYLVVTTFEFAKTRKGAKGEKLS